jgi:hypothetical protein
MKTLTQEQCWSIASYLRSAAGLFEGFAKDGTVLSEQFEKQRKDAIAMAELFEFAESASITEAVEAVN